MLATERAACGRHSAACCALATSLASPRSPPQTKRVHHCSSACSRPPPPPRARTTPAASSASSGRAPAWSAASCTAPSWCRCRPHVRQLPMSAAAIAPLTWPWHSVPNAAHWRPTWTHVRFALLQSVSMSTRWPLPPPAATQELLEGGTLKSLVQRQMLQNPTPLYSDMAGLDICLQVRRSRRAVCDCQRLPAAAGARAAGAKLHAAPMAPHLQACTSVSFHPPLGNPALDPGGARPALHAHGAAHGDAPRPQAGQRFAHKCGGMGDCACCMQPVQHAR